jgi:hypothetical protein
MYGIPKTSQETLSLLDDFLDARRPLDGGVFVGTGILFPIEPSVRAHCL